MFFKYWLNDVLNLGMHAGSQISLIFVGFPI